MKIVGSSSGLHSPEFKRRKDRIRKVKILLWTLLALCIIALPIYLLRTHKFLISSVVVSGNLVTKDVDIEKIVSNDLSGNHLFIFPKSNALLYPKKKIEQDLLLAIPRLSSVKLSLRNAQTLSVAVTEHLPAALYCSDVALVSAPTDCYLVDDTGYIFSVAPAFSGGVYLVYSQVPAIESPIGNRLLPEDDFEKVGGLVANLGSLGVYPRALVIENDEYHALLSNGALVEWEAKADPGVVLANLRAFLDSAAIKAQPDFLDKILYLDLRFDDKIFYKFRNE